MSNESLKQTVCNLQIEVEQERVGLEQQRSDLLGKVAIMRQEAYQQMHNLYGEMEFPPEVQQWFATLDEIESQVKR